MALEKSRARGPHGCSRFKESRQLHHAPKIHSHNTHPSDSFRGRSHDPTPQPYLMTFYSLAQRMGSARAETAMAAFPQLLLILCVVVGGARGFIPLKLPHHAFRPRASGIEMADKSSVQIDTKKYNNLGEHRDQRAKKHPGAGLCNGDEKGSLLQCIDQTHTKKC